ncbi:hypothetical protein MKW92_011350 [Papaver armeniacum]|nr:hypothetical protein MKW92_011350 [Papaver armeniacum]
MASSSLSEVSERRGASFLSDAQTYLTQSGLDVTFSLAFLRERMQIYMTLAASRTAKIPDIDKCLDIVVTLQAKKGTGGELVNNFEVSEGIYSLARIEESDTVCLWLVANVMLEYTSEEGNFWPASALLQKNLDNAKASLEAVIADLQFLRDQVTIRQVTIARVYNWDVHRRRSKQVTELLWKTREGFLLSHGLFLVTLVRVCCSI